LREKIGPDAAEAAGCGGATIKAGNEGCPDLRRNRRAPSMLFLRAGMEAARDVAIFPHFFVARR